MSVKMAISLLEKLDKKTDDHGERLARIEQKITDQNGHVKQNMRDIQMLNRNQWMAIGAIGLIGVMLKVVGVL